MEKLYTGIKAIDEATGGLNENEIFIINSDNCIYSKIFAFSIVRNNVIYNVSNFKDKKIIFYSELIDIDKYLFKRWIQQYSNGAQKEFCEKTQNIYFAGIENVQNSFYAENSTINIIEVNNYELMKIIMYQINTNIDYRTKAYYIIYGNNKYIKPKDVIQLNIKSGISYDNESNLWENSGPCVAILDCKLKLKNNTKTNFQIVMDNYHCFHISPQEE